LGGLGEALGGLLLEIPMHAGQQFHGMSEGFQSFVDGHGLFQDSVKCLGPSRSLGKQTASPHTIFVYEA